MPNGNIDYILGQIQAKLEQNDITHEEMRGILSNLDRKLDAFYGSTNKTITGLCADVGGLNGKASVWGGFVAFIVSAIMGVIGWFVVHLQGR